MVRNSSALSDAPPISPPSISGWEISSLAFAPFMLPPVVVGLMAIVVLDPSMGVANYLLKSAGLPTSLVLASSDFVIFTVVLIDTWQWTPFVALIVLGGLQSLPTRVYEAAAIDGATGWRRTCGFTPGATWKPCWPGCRCVTWSER